jgi:hypothetical protein
LLDAGNVHDDVEEALALDGVFDVCVNEERVCFEGNAFHHDLEIAKAAGFGALNLTTKNAL